MSSLRLLSYSVALCSTLRALPLPAQNAALDLSALQRAAVTHDARAQQRALLARATDLRLDGIRDALKPQFTLNASNTHLSDVTYLPVKLPTVNVPIPPKDRWSSSLDVSQIVYDGGASSRKSAVEQARLREGQAGVDAALEPLRDEVTRTFFAAALLQASEHELALMIVDLEQVLADTRVRVREGAALGRDSAAVRAEWRNAQSKLNQLKAQRHAALANLSRLTGIDIADDATLPMPDFSEALGKVGADAATLRARPEFLRLSRTRDRLDAEQALTVVENRPRLVAFGSTGYGRPGLNQFKPDVAGFWQAGIKLEWQPFTWGSASRNRELAALQQQTLQTEEQSLAQQLARLVQGDLDDRARLRAQLAADDEVIALREESLKQGEAQRKEGAITAAEAVALRTDVAEARLARERHRVELAQAEARIATTLGLTPR